MSVDILDAVIERLRDALPDSVQVGDATAWGQGGPRTVIVRSSLTVDPGTRALAEIEVNVDVWDRGPDTSRADDLAHQVVQTLEGMTAQTQRQSLSWLALSGREQIPEEGDGLAHISMRFTGRGLRREAIIEEG